MKEWTAPQVVAAIVVVTVFVLIAAGFAWGLIRAGMTPAPAMLVVTLSLLTFAALAGGLVWRDATALALAGTGFGAISGAVTSTFTSPQHPPSPSDDDAHGNQPPES